MKWRQIIPFKVSVLVCLLARFLYYSKLKKGHDIVQNLNVPIDPFYLEKILGLQSTV